MTTNRDRCWIGQNRVRFGLKNMFVNFLRQSWLRHWLQALDSSRRPSKYYGFNWWTPDCYVTQNVCHRTASETNNFFHTLHFNSVAVYRTRRTKQSANNWMLPIEKLFHCLSGQNRFDWLVNQFTKRTLQKHKLFMTQANKRKTVNECESAVSLQNAIISWWNINLHTELTLVYLSHT